MRIEVCGGIASGKTTLANLLHETLDFVQVNEQHTANPFWKSYMAEPKRFCFEAEIVFLLQHYHQIQLSSNAPSQVVCDFSLFQDAAYAKLGLDGKKLDVFFHVYNSCISDVSEVDFIIHLTCSEQVLLERIAKRARKEEKPISVDFLKSLNSKIVNEIYALPKGINIIEVDSENINFATNAEDQRRLVQTLREQLKV